MCQNKTDLKNEQSCCAADRMTVYSLYCHVSSSCCWRSVFYRKAAGQTDRFNPSVHLWRTHYCRRSLASFFFQSLQLPSVKASQSASFCLSLSKHSYDTRKMPLVTVWSNVGVLLDWISSRNHNIEHLPVLQVFGQDHQPHLLKMKPSIFFPPLFALWNWLF